MSISKLQLSQLPLGISDISFISSFSVRCFAHFCPLSLRIYVGGFGLGVREEIFRRVGTDVQLQSLRETTGEQGEQRRWLL